MYYKLTCILYALLCGQNFILVKSGRYRTPARQHLGTSSRLQYGSGEGALRWSCLRCYGPPVVAAPQLACPEPLGSQEPPALS
jgi:hypothetical protein